MYSIIYENKDRSFRYNYNSNQLEWIVERYGDVQVINSYKLPVKDWEANREDCINEITNNIDGLSKVKL